MVWDTQTVVHINTKSYQMVSDPYQYEIIPNGVGQTVILINTKSYQMVSDPYQYEIIPNSVGSLSI